MRLWTWSALGPRVRGPESVIGLIPGYPSAAMADLVPNCPVHPEVPATGTCERCGNFMCGECVGQIAQGTVCRACEIRIASKGKLAQVPKVGIGLIVHGVLLCCMSVLNVVGAVFYYFFFQSLDMPNAEQQAILLASVFAMNFFFHLIPGVLQIMAGIKVQKYQGRIFALVALGSGVLTALGCYCFPTAIGLTIWGLVVLLSDGVEDSFS
ncbi:MAG: hypothetical protein AAGF12_11005 [Myxococcota bacterium]